MSYTRPTNYPDFCLTGTRTQPSGSETNTGYQPDQSPPAEEHNYLFGTTGDWVRWLDQLTQDMLENQGFDFTVGVGGDYADLNAAMADSNVTAGARLLVISSLAVATTQLITKNNIEIALKPAVAITNNGAGTGISIAAGVNEVRIKGGKMSGFTTAILINASALHSIIGEMQFVSNTNDITDNSNTGATYAIVNQ